MKLLVIFIAFLLNVVFGIRGIANNWSETETKQFLSDVAVPYNREESNERCCEKANKKINVILGQSQKVKEDTDKTGKYLRYLLDEDDQHVGRWIFETWHATTLKKFLKGNHISFGEEAQPEELLRLARENYDEIALKNKASGKYLSEWLFRNWNRAELKNWLQRYGIEFNNKEAKRKLAKKVRFSVYPITKSLQATKQNLFDSLDLSNAKLFDKDGNIRDDFVDHLTTEQLIEYLSCTPTLSWGPLRFSELNENALRDVLKKHKGIFQNDIFRWVQATKERVSPFLSKGKEEAQNLINDSFLVGVEQWSKEKLQQFLRIRGVRFFGSSSKEELLRLVKQNRNVPVKSQKESNRDAWRLKNGNPPTQELLPKTLYEKALGYFETILGKTRA